MSHHHPYIVNITFSNSLSLSREPWEAEQNSPQTLAKTHLGGPVASAFHLPQPLRNSELSMAMLTVARRSHSVDIYTCGTPGYACRWHIWMKWSTPGLRFSDQIPHSAHTCSVGPLLHQKGPPWVRPCAIARLEQASWMEPLVIIIIINPMSSSHQETPWLEAGVPSNRKADSYVSSLPGQPLLPYFLPSLQACMYQIHKTDT